MVFVLTLSCTADLPRTAPVHLSAGAEQIKKGNNLYQKGCYKGALEHFFRAHELYAVSDQQSGIAMSMNNIGSVYRALGDASGALVFFEEAALLYENAGDKAGQRQALSNRAAAMIDLGELAGAEEILNQASLIRTSTDTGPFVPIRKNRGILLKKKGQFKESEQVLREALAGSALYGLSETAALEYALGDLMLETGRAHEAAGHFQAALNADRQSGFYKGIADDLARLAEVAWQMKEEPVAIHYWKRSIHVYAMLGMNRERDETLGRLQSALKKTGKQDAVTAIFIKRWEDGKRLENPCEQ
jgi:tetratricopeptide (TPR) repeat protein